MNMQMDTFFWVTTLVKCVILLVVLIHVAPIMAWVERRGSALMQNRLGPNRIGPLGLLQSLADGIKFMFKEDPIPGHVSKFYYVLSPIISLVPAFMTFAVIPFAGPLQLGNRTLVFQIADLNVGFLYIFAVASLGVYGIIMGGWASNNKYALLGSLRSSSQMISYELSMGLSIIGLVMAYSTVHLNEMVQQQIPHLTLFGHEIPFVPAWGVFIQPIGFIVFLTAAFAETNRLPFDLPEGESEIVAGYHLEFGSMKFALFMMAEYVNMLTACGLVATLFFGGWGIWPFGHVLNFIQQSPAFVNAWGGLGGLLSHVGLVSDMSFWTSIGPEVLRVLFQLGAFASKVAFGMWFFVWVRWTLPRFRYDQLMDLGWKVMLPLSLANIMLTGLAISMGWI